jgi:isoamylase
MEAQPSPGNSHPLGATAGPDGVNFCVYSKSAEALELLFFDTADDARPSRVIRLERNSPNRTRHYWHVFVPGITAGQLYAYRVHGLHEPERGLRFDGEKVLLDPYGRSVVVPEDYSREAAHAPGDNAPRAMKSVVTESGTYDWEGDTPLSRPFSHTVIYEMHVRGFTRHERSGVVPEKRGTYAGLIEKIPYLQELGVTAVELLPVFQFDPREAPAGLTNYWGYNPVSFFAPHAAYSANPDPAGVLDEFRDMVKALHRAGIEVILDVVYNHTSEGDENGPTFCFRGFENETYYLLESDRGLYSNFSGTGNTLNANHSVVRRLILDSLRYWVREMHIDGFRFDLASILSRDPEGRPLANPPLLWDIETDPVLSGAKLIAEAWDAAGLYQVGSFFGDHWKEWNGHFRDDVRAFVKGEAGFAGKMASRFLASPDIYGHQDREPEQSINFVTCHDGFTLADLVSYDEKNNAANQEDNRDGHGQNLSWNCGIEGPTEDSSIRNLRRRQMKNFFCLNLLSLGVPMLLMGDEIARTQRGNNNAYCQNNELTWFDWSLLDENAELFRFVRKLIHFRLHQPGRTRNHDLSLTELIEQTPLHWHGVKTGQPDWGPASRSLAFTVETTRGWLYVVANAYWESLNFEVPVQPAVGNSVWRRIIDTSLETPNDFIDPKEAPDVVDGSYQVASRSVVVLMVVGSVELTSS